MGIKLRIGSAVLFFLFLSGCNSVVTDYVKESRPAGIVNPPTVETAGDEEAGRKISPGQIKARSANLSIVGNVTPTQRVLTSPTVSARVSLSRGRSGP